MNLNSCCGKCLFNSNEHYIEIKNLISNFKIYFILQYTYQCKIITKQSPIIDYSQKKKLYYNKTSENVCINVLESIGETTKFLFNISLIAEKNFCFNVTGTAEHPLINRVSC